MAHTMTTRHSHSAVPVAPPERRKMAGRPRLLAAIAAALIALSFLFPLWALHLHAPQYPETLNLYVYAYKFEGSHNPEINDLQEINTLNHYIGMADIRQEDFPELKAMPVTLAVTTGVVLLGAGIASWPLLAGGTLLLAATGVGGLSSAYYKLYYYGHHLSPDAALKVKGFTPPLLGSNRLVNFTTIGLFGWGGMMLMAAGGLLLAALYLHLRRREA